jgi:hypothetical protein
MLVAYQTHPIVPKILRTVHISTAIVIFDMTSEHWSSAAMFGVIEAAFGLFGYLATLLFCVVIAGNPVSMPY